MRIALKRRSARWTVSFLTRGGLVTALLLAIMNVGYLAAQAVRQDPNDLWRQTVSGNLASFMAWRESSLLPSFAIAIAAFIVIALGHFFTFGPKDYTAKDEKDLIPWYNVWERIIHGIVLISFLVLMISGLMITYGRYFGGGGLTLTLRQFHEIAGFVYTPVIIVMVLMWIKEALPAAYDLEWFLKAGGYLGYKGQLKSGKFNAGQKVWFWVIVVTAVVHIWTGLALFYQIGLLPTLRLYVMLHLIATVPMVLMFIVHVYMSALGAKGALMSIVTGKFSRTAALKYHSDAAALKKLKAAPAADD
jgi:formate dehydrogenase subunit gamma